MDAMFLKYYQKNVLVRKKSHVTTSPKNIRQYGKDINSAKNIKRLYMNNSEFDDEESDNFYKIIIPVFSFLQI